MRSKEGVYKYIRRIKIYFIKRDNCLEVNKGILEVF